MSPRSATVAAIKSLVPVVAQERGVSETDLLFGRALKHFLARRELFWRCRELTVIGAPRAFAA